MENLNFIIGKNLQILRKKNKLTQIELAEKLNYSDKAISKWEKGETTPDVYTLVKIAQHYNVSLNYLLGIDTENYNKKEVFVKPQTLLFIL